MTHLLFAALLICLSGFTTALQSSYPPSAYIPLEHRTGLRPLAAIEELPTNAYEFHIIPNDESALVQYTKPSLSVWDLIAVPSPITAIANIASKAIYAGKWLLLNSGFIALGAALVIGFCAFTPYCTLVIEKPLASQIRTIKSSIPYLDDVECFFRRAYHKYHDL